MYTLGCVFRILCAAVLPVVMAVVLCVRHKKIWKPMLFGALTFTVFQMFIRIPILKLVLEQQAWYIVMSNTQPILCALFLGGTAALFEEGGRFIVMSLFLKKQRETLDAVAFGVGHGGIEAIFFVGIGAVAMLIIRDYSGVTPGLLFAGGVERLSALATQIGFSVMVMKSIREKNALWLLLAFLIHTLVDFGAVLASDELNVWTLEIIVLLIAAALAWFVVREYKKRPSAPAESR